MPALSNAEGNTPRPAARRGAPRGNLNALKTGASSRQLKTLIEKMRSDPELWRLMQAFAPNRQTYDRSLQPAINAYAAQTRRGKERAKRELARRYDWLPYFDDGEAPF